MPHPQLLKEDSQAERNRLFAAKGPSRATLPRRTNTLRRSVKPKAHPGMDDTGKRPIVASGLHKHSDIVKKLLCEYLIDSVYKVLPSLVKQPSGLKAFFSRDKYKDLETTPLSEKKELSLRQAILADFCRLLSRNKIDRAFGQDMGDQLHQLENRIVCPFSCPNPCLPFFFNSLISPSLSLSQLSTLSLS